MLNLQNLVIQINFISNIELEDIADFIEKLQRTSIQINTTSPTKEELLSVIKKLKYGKPASDIPI